METSRLELKLLGNPVIAVDGEPVSSKIYNKVLALLSYFVLEKRTHSREHLADLLWPDSPYESARLNLRQALFRLREALQDKSFLLATKNSLSFNPGENYYLDAEEFAREEAHCPKEKRHDHCAQCLSRMEKKADLYRGPLLDGLTIEDAPDFEDWLCIQRETLHRHALSHLERLVACHEENGNIDKALRFSSRYTELEPWDENGHRTLMRLLAQNGQTGAALSQYEICKQKLSAELGVFPSKETTDLFEEIRSGKLLPPPSLKPPPSSQIAERRQVTVLYSRLFIIGENDPDDIAEKLQSPQKILSDIIHHFEGHIAQVHGGSILCYFGFPTAHEDSARRAVRAALLIHKKLESSHLSIRTSIHTGPVVTGNGMPDTVGLTSNTAIRMRDLEGDIIVSEATRRLVEGYFLSEEGGTHVLKEIQSPVRVHRILGESGAQSRLEACDNLTPFVGREKEMEKILRAWKKASMGKGSIILITGEAGIGKSRLIHAFRDRLKGKPCAVRELHAFPEFRNTPLNPIIAMVESIVGFMPDDSRAVKLNKLVEYLRIQHPKSEQDAFPILAQLLGLHATDQAKFSPQKQKDKVFSVLLHLLGSLSAKQPVLLVVEDVQWLDPSSLELLSLFSGQSRNSKILALLSARSGFDPAWREYEEIGLDPLCAENVKAIARHLGAKDNVIEQIAAKSDGIPLFAEEMARLFRDKAQADIPEKLHELLAARLDSVGVDAKQTAQLASTIGREFDFDLLSQASNLDEKSLADSLSVLKNSGLILGESNFKFKHALIAEVAYQSQTKSARQIAHKNIAGCLLANFPDLVDGRPEIMARHLAQGGDAKKAIDFWLKAGKKDAALSAYAEALEHFNQALALIGMLPQDAARDRLEFEIQSMRGGPLIATQGHGSAEAGEAFSRTLELSSQLGDDTKTFQALWGLCVCASSRSGYLSALKLAENLLDLAHGDPLQLQQAHYAMGNSLFWLGKLEEARSNLEKACALYEPTHQEELVARYFENTAVKSRALLSWALWLQGFPDQAVYSSEQSLRLAREIEHPYSLGFALSCAAFLHQWMGEPEKCRDFSEKLMTLSRERGFFVFHAMSVILQEWSRKSGNVSLIIESMESVRAAICGSEIPFLVPLVEVCLDRKDYEGALNHLTYATNSAENCGSRFFEAELMRLKGECLMAVARKNEAHIYFMRALEISRALKEKSLELRAAMSLAKHFGEKSWLGEAAAWFEEGPDTPDLRQAQKMLSPTPA